MTKPVLRSWIYVVIGALVIMALRTLIYSRWHSYYSLVPFRGYEKITAEGKIPPTLFGAPRALHLTVIVLALLPLCTFWFSAVRTRTASLSLWGGVVIGVAALLFLSMAQGEDAPMWPIDLVIAAIMTGTPLLVGALAFTILKKTTARS